jgi:sulfide dehydrogenase cytochrome subunit
MRLKSILPSIIIALFFTVAGVSAQDSKNFKMCVMCHGENGLSEDGEAPIIAGMDVVVQEEALFAYRDGDRDCGETPMMCKVAGKLSDEEIEEFAAYYSEMAFQPAGDAFDAALGEQGKALHAEKCSKCHGDKDDINLESGMLFGQKMAYLRYALQQYVAGERAQLPAMQKQTETLDADQIEALLNYYANYQP